MDCLVQRRPDYVTFCSCVPVESEFSWELSARRWMGACPSTVHILHIKSLSRGFVVDEVSYDNLVVL